LSIYTNYPATLTAVVLDVAAGNSSESCTVCPVGSYTSISGQFASGYPEILREG
jgi:hypothetical protein